ncbi:TPA: hypothetical protein ACGFXK_003180 [Vibrio cholerae]
MKISIDANGALAKHARYCFDNRKLLVYDGSRYFVTHLVQKGIGRGARLWLDLDGPK